MVKPSAKIIWIGGTPLTENFTKSKKGNSWRMMRLTFHDKRESATISLDYEKGNWILKTLETLSVANEKKITFSQLKTDYEEQFEDFELFWYSKQIVMLRQFGLLIF